MSFQAEEEAIMRPALAAIILSTGFAARPSVAAEITALISLPAKPVVQDLTPKFERTSGKKLNITYSGGLDTRNRLAAGEVFDIVVANRADLDPFVKTGKFAADSLVDLMKSQIGVAIKAGGQKPDVSTEAGLKDALLGAKAIGYSTGSSGDYLKRSLLPKLGIADQVAGKMKQVPSGTSAATLVASGEADIAIQQTSELLNHSGVEYVGPLPANLQLTSTYSAGIHSKAHDTDGAKAFIQMLSSPEAAPVITRAGLKPE